MPTKSEKKRLKKLNEQRKADGVEPITRKKIRASLSAAKPAREKSSSRRARKPEEHPLDKVRHKLAHDEFSAGMVLRVICEKLDRSGLPSTHAMLISSGGGGLGGLSFTEEQTECYKAKQRIAQVMAGWEFEIVRKVCGEAWPIPDAVHAHAICHPDGVLHCFRNALVHLREAIAASRVPWRVHREASERDLVKPPVAA